MQGRKELPDVACGCISLMEESRGQKAGSGRLFLREGIGLGGLVRGTARTWLLLAGKLRRFYLVHLRKGYVRGKLSTREGECHQCGTCCSFIFRCPALSQEGLCRLYHGGRWLACRLFPVDERDISDVAVAGGRCGYH